MGNPLARPREAGAQCDAQALPIAPKSSPSAQLSALGPFMAWQVTIAEWPPLKTRMRSRFRQIVFQIAGDATRIDGLSVVVVYDQRLALLEFLYCLRPRPMGRLAAFLQPLASAPRPTATRLRVSMEAVRNFRYWAEVMWLRDSEKDL